jgi:hypothetical protein
MAKTALPEHRVGSKAETRKVGRKKGKSHKIGRNKIKCANYRIRVGKPNGPGQPGNKAGKNR